MSISATTSDRLPFPAPANAKPDGNGPATLPQAPRLVTPLDLPGELLRFVTRCMIPDSPFLLRPSGSVPHFRIAAAMDGLRSWSQTCKPFHAVVANLRKDSDHLPFRQLAGRAEYEFRHRSDQVPFRRLAGRAEYEFRRRTDQARLASIERYGIDPLHWDGDPPPVRLRAFDVEDMIRSEIDLQQCAGQARAIESYLSPGATDAGLYLLAKGYAACNCLNELAVSVDGPVPLALVSGLAKAPPALKVLKLKGSTLSAGLFQELAASPVAGQIESLFLQATSITPEDCTAMAQAAGHFTRLRFLAVHGAMLSRECCELLAAALPAFVQLESLQLGRENGGIDAAGALVLVAAARSGGKVARLGLHNLEGQAAIVPVLEALQQYSGLKELALTGPLDEASSLHPWSLLTGDASCLCALDLEDCGLNEQQMEGLAAAMQSSTRLQELRLAREQFTDKGARALARAIKVSTSLLHLTLDDCRLNATTQARRLGAGVARNKSLLELNVLLKRGPREYADDVTDTFGDGVAASSTLLHFGLSSEVRNVAPEVSSRIKDLLQRNRIRKSTPDVSIS